MNARDSYSRSLGPYAVIDMPSQQLETPKIERLLQLISPNVKLKMLKMGAEFGDIAHCFGTHPSLRYEVDVQDASSRFVKESYRYHHVMCTMLSFVDVTFNVAPSNHVIEHVGDAVAQCSHPREFWRVLKLGGCGYLAVPNRWMLTEPHYLLVFLSWLSMRWRSPYLRVMRGAMICEPLALPQVERLLTGAKLTYHNLCVEAHRVTLDSERSMAQVTRWSRRVPDCLLTPFRRFILTLIYELRKLVEDRQARSSGGVP